MCQWIFWTGSQCAHRGHNQRGEPIPIDEKQFMLHGKWDVLLCDQYYAREQATGAHQMCSNMRPKPTYWQMTADMSNYGYRLSSPNTADGGKDYRCCRCRGTLPQSRTGRRDPYPRQPDWNAPGTTGHRKSERVYEEDDWEARNRGTPRYQW